MDKVKRARHAWGGNLRKNVHIFHILEGFGSFSTCIREARKKKKSNITHTQKGVNLNKDFTPHTFLPLNNI